MAEGRSNAAIASELVISEGTVEKHVANIFTKFDLPESQSDHRRVLAVLRYPRVSNIGKGLRALSRQDGEAVAETDGRGEGDTRRVARSLDSAAPGGASGSDGRSRRRSLTTSDQPGEPRANGPLRPMG